MVKQVQSKSNKICLVVLVFSYAALLLNEKATLPNDSSPSPTFLLSKEENAPSLVFLDLPLSVKEIIINVGSNLDPIMPAYTTGPCALSIAIEPIVGCKIRNHCQLSVLNAAVSDKLGVASMIKNNGDCVSLSLAEVAKNDSWNTDKECGDGKRVIVPVITLSSVLNVIPGRVQEIRLPFKGQSIGHGHCGHSKGARDYSVD